VGSIREPGQVTGQILSNLCGSTQIFRNLFRKYRVVGWSAAEASAVNMQISFWL